VSLSNDSDQTRNGETHKGFSGATDEIGKVARTNVAALVSDAMLFVTPYESARPEASRAWAAGTTVLTECLYVISGVANATPGK